MRDSMELKAQQFAEKLELLGYSKRCIEDYPAYLRLFFDYLRTRESVHSVKEIKPEHLTAYHAYLQYEHQHAKGKYLSSITVRTRLSVVKTFYRIMHKEKLVEQDYSGLISIPRRKKSLPRHVPTEADMRKLLAIVVPADPLTTRDRALLELMYATGLRNQEVRTLTVDGLDLSEKTVRVTGKGNKDRVVPVGDWVLPYLREYLEAARPRLVNPKAPTELLFLSKRGRIITQANLGDMLKKYARKAGMEQQISPHSLRHACATHLLKGGADIRYVQELLGHADLSSTQVYTRISIESLKEAHRKYHPAARESIEA